MDSISVRRPLPHSKRLLAALHPRDGNWNPKSGAGASIFVHSPLTKSEIRVGAVPADFGEREELVHCTFNQMPATYVRIDADGEASLGFSKVEFF